MEKGINAKKGLYAGTGTGIILFLLVGMFPGSLIGGAIGLMISQALLGTPVEPTLLPRIITIVSMVAGIIGAAGVFVVGTSVLGWTIGAAIDTVTAGHETTELDTAEESSRI